MQYTIGALATALEAQAVGDTSLTITALAEPGDAGVGDLALAGTPKYAATLKEGRAEAAMLWADADWQALGLKAAILPVRPRFAMSRLTSMMDQGQGFAPGIHGAAIIDPTAQIGAGVSIGPGAVIGAEAVIGDGSVIGPLCYVGWQAHLGPGTFLREHVSIGAKVRIGARFIAHPGARVGGDGFSFVTPEKSGAESVRETLGEQGESADQAWARIASLGSVEIADDVEIGSNTTVDNGTIRATRIGARTKIDALVQIGHNVVIGTDNLLCALVGIAGSTTMGNFVVCAGQVGVADNLKIGDRVVITAGSKVLSSVHTGKVMMGYPATEMKGQIDTYKALRRLPRYLRDIADLKKAVFKADPSD
ncbi:UDP-3-O-(3-hydroxymyristoyl)glucosamine N-acyltransferase [uncultured Tateyamaria sp.]|uniref:UDP-3-O-(3-hydroxymyristoyl)glucosamine N-acyltransferase n=1 Tax=uncultured Tateyamaria sp. TaxID=455651 RepID=UPI00261DCBDB|nr:UDP-3-O-(3-hydroxymyristoyl)glucosamine N-acyltransferase [uncultured Tateyamaria sp.]